MPRRIRLGRILRLLGAKKGKQVRHAARKRVRFATAWCSTGFFPLPGSPAVLVAAPAGNSGKLQRQQSWPGHAPPWHEPQPDSDEDRDVHQQGAEDGQKEAPRRHPPPEIIGPCGAGDAIFPVDAPRA